MGHLPRTPPFWNTVGTLKMPIKFFAFHVGFLPILLDRNASNLLGFEHIITNVLLFARYNSTIDLQLQLLPVPRYVAALRTRFICAKRRSRLISS